jgi:hypothetical protein
MGVSGADMAPLNRNGGKQIRRDLDMHHAPGPPDRRIQMPTDPAVIYIDRMPRGGPDASWLDRRLQTDRLEFLDRDDVDDRVKRVNEVSADETFPGPECSKVSNPALYPRWPSNCSLSTSHAGTSSSAKLSVTIGCSSSFRGRSRSAAVRRTAGRIC